MGNNGYKIQENTRPRIQTGLHRSASCTLSRPLVTMRKSCWGQLGPGRQQLTVSPVVCWCLLWQLLYEVVPAHCFYLLPNRGGCKKVRKWFSLSFEPTSFIHDAEIKEWHPGQCMQIVWNRISSFPSCSSALISMLALIFPLPVFSVSVWPFLPSPLAFSILSW